jgi:hypothetical protein
MCSVEQTYTSHFPAAPASRIYPSGAAPLPASRAACTAARSGTGPFARVSRSPAATPSSACMGCWRRYRSTVFSSRSGTLARLVACLSPVVLLLWGTLCFPSMLCVFSFCLPRPSYSRYHGLPTRSRASFAGQNSPVKMLWLRVVLVWLDWGSHLAS